MNCKKCGTENVESSKFCTKCGHKLVHELSCTKCGKTLQQDAIFCVECGTQANSPASEKLPHTGELPGLTNVAQSPLAPIVQNTPLRINKSRTKFAVIGAAFVVTLALASGGYMMRKSVKTFRDCPDCPEMVEIPAGSFEMGSNEKIFNPIAGNNDEERPVHHVTIEKSFAMGMTKVTKGQWKAIMGNNPNPAQSHYNNYPGNCGDNCPVQNVSWEDAQEFIKKLNAITGKHYRLPSEAEWEYACRAGGHHAYCGSDDVNSVAWYADNSNHNPHPVATKQANAWGLYDMSGNVREWIEDNYHESYDGAPTDGSVWSGNGRDRVVRSGSWDYIPEAERASARNSDNPTSNSSLNGFRVAMTLLPSEQARPVAQAADPTTPLVSAPKVSESIPIQVLAAAWIKDANGCMVYDPAPSAGETITWSGACLNGYADGSGKLSLFIDGKPSENYDGTFIAGKINGHATDTNINGDRDEGEYKDGKLNGHGTSMWANGNRYEGSYLNGMANGFGTYTMSSGEVYSGTFTNGCFHSERMNITVGTTNEKCGF